MFSYFHDNFRAVITTQYTSKLFLERRSNWIEFAPKYMTKFDHVSFISEYMIERSSQLTIRFNCCWHILENCISNIQTCELLDLHKGKTHRKFESLANCLITTSCVNIFHYCQPSVHFVRLLSAFNKVHCDTELLRFKVLISINQYRLQTGICSNLYKNFTSNHHFDIFVLIILQETRFSSGKIYTRPIIDNRQLYKQYYKT